MERMNVSDRIGVKMAKGAIWMVLFKLLDRSIGLVSTIILARLLVPADFGLIAMATSIIAILELLNSFNFDIALIQKEAADRHHFDTAWTLNICFGGAIAMALIALAIPASAFYREPRLEMVIYALALGSLVQGFENVGTVWFRKDLTLSREFVFLLCKRVLGFIITVALAIELRNYWALVAGMLMNRVVGVIISFAAHPFRPRLCLIKAGELFHFSKWLFLNSVITVFNGRLPHFVIGRMAGPHATGLYSISYEIASLPTTELVAPINRAVYPGYTKLYADGHELSNTFLAVIGMVAFLVVPAGAGIVILADQFVTVILGQRWAETVPAIQILAVYGIINAVVSNCGLTCVALGKPRLVVFYSGALSFLLVPMSLYLTPMYGAVGAGLSLLIAITIVAPIIVGILLRELKVAFIALFSRVWRSLLATGIMSALVMLAKRGGDYRSISGLLLLILIGAVSYFLSAFVLWLWQAKPRGAEESTLRALNGSLQSMRAAYRGRFQ